MIPFNFKKLFLLPLVALLGACGEEQPVVETPLEPGDCGPFVSLNANAYGNGDSDPFTIIRAEVEGDCMNVTYSASGCDGSSWVVDMVDAQAIAESLPVQRSFKMLLENNEDCMAIPTQTVSFDLRSIQVESEDVTLINLDGYDKQLTYIYGAVDTVLIAKWDLVNINGGLTAADIDVTEGAITWEFSVYGVKVINNADIEGYDAMATGGYLYAIEEEGGEEVLTIDGESIGTLAIDADGFSVDQRAADGFQRVFRPHIDDSAIEGTWHLIDVSCECAPAEMEAGDHIWTFDVSENALQVDNKAENDLQILESGDYHVAIGSQSIVILGVAYDYYFEDGYLFLGDMPESDGPLLKLSKVE